MPKCDIASHRLSVLGLHLFMCYHYSAAVSNIRMQKEHIVDVRKDLRFRTGNLIRSASIVVYYVYQLPEPSDSLTEEPMDSHDTPTLCRNGVPGRVPSGATSMPHRLGRLQ